MRVYTFHYLPESPEPDRDVVLVGEGFCWPAFLVAPLWALWHRLWLVFIVVAVCGIALDLALDFAGADSVTGVICGLAFSAIVGFGANDWRRASMTRRGYRMAGVVAAADRDAALRRFFDLNPDFDATAGRPGGPAIGGLMAPS